MAFTYIDLFPEVIPYKVIDPTASVTEISNETTYDPILVYTAKYDTVASYKWPFHKRTDGYISGITIDETSVAMPSVLITCLWNKNMEKVGTTTSDINGNWIMYGLDPDDTYGYTIIAQDPTTGEVYNSVSYDKIIPVEPA